jgi:amidase
MTIPVNGLSTSGFVEPADTNGQVNRKVNGYEPIPKALKTVLIEHDNPVPTSDDQSWRAIAARKQADREVLLRPEARIASSSIPSNASDLARSSGSLTKREVEITSLPAHVLAERIASRMYTSYEVTLAYCKSATIAQDATNCLTEIYFEEGLARARELDAHLDKEGKTVGQLHGVPVSIKDHIDVKGMDASTGFVGWAYEKYVDKDAVVVRCVREAGGIIYCKTANPQSLLVSWKC